MHYNIEAIASEAITNTETMIYQDLDMNLLKRNREFGNVQTWKDRRKDLFSLTYSENGKSVIV